MATTQIIGSTITNTMEVEAATKAARIVLKPDDYGSLGVYSVAGKSAIMAAGLGTSIPIFSFRWGAPDKFAMIKRISFSAGCDTVAFAIGIVQFNMFMARSWTASDSGGTSLVPSGNENKLRTSMGTSLLGTNGDCRIASTGGLTVGTRSLDGDPTASLACGVSAVAGLPMIPIGTTFFDARPGEHKLILSQNEGFTIMLGGVAIAATGTWKFSCRVEWAEDTAYDTKAF